MSKLRIYGFGAAGLAVAGIGLAWVLPSLAAGGETPLNVTPGLWEMTSQSDTSGPPPIPPEAMANMTPEQKQKFEAAMQAMMAKQHQPHTVRACVTADEIKRGFTGGDQDKECQKTIVNSTPKLLDMTMTCTGDGQQSTGTFHYEAADPQTVAGNIDMHISRGAQTMEIKNEMHGKWVAADCGDVKPAQ
jgi:Protein of unknown function (DUF3617)